MVNHELRYKIFKLLQGNPEMNQRLLAQELGVSLGKANYCMKALAARGLIKAKRFRNSSNKLAYVYLLTPKGIEEKARVTIGFLKQKDQEYKAIQEEIRRLSEEVAVINAGIESIR